MRLVYCTTALLLAFSAATALAQPTPPTPAAPGDIRLVWDLTRLFPTDAAWDAERLALAAEIPALAALKAGFGRDASALRSALDQMSAASQRLSRLWVYASTQTSTANGDRRNLERSALMGALWGQYSSALAWVDPALQALGAAKLAAFQAAEPGLQPHATRIRKTLAEAPHTLAPEAETALAALTPVLNSFSATRELLVNADVAWPSITLDGQVQRLSDTGYSRLRAHADRSPRAWATAQGVATLPLAAVGLVAVWGGMAALGSPFPMPLGPRPGLFIALMLATGLLASWAGTLCWNEASQRLPPGLAGQLIVFETLSALAYAFVLRGHMPPPLALAGVVLLVAGVAYALRARPNVAAAPGA